jgi:hypothetical protein
VNVTVAWALPAVAVPIVGAPGTVVAAIVDTLASSNIMPSVARTTVDAIVAIFFTMLMMLIVLILTR